jgi:hypothetical protein
MIRACSALDSAIHVPGPWILFFVFRMFRGKVRLEGGTDRSTFFLILSAKILISLDLGRSDLVESAQNIEPEGLICKILRNKDLAVGSK